MTLFYKVRLQRAFLIVQPGVGPELTNRIKKGVAEGVFSVNTWQYFVA